MHRLRMLASSDLRELLHWLQRIAAPLARHGVILFIQVDDPQEPLYLDVRLDGISSPEEADQMLAEKLCHYILGPWQYRYLRRCLERDHSYLSLDEVDHLCAVAFRNARNLRSKDSVSETLWSKTPLVEDIIELMGETEELHLDGMLRFHFQKQLDRLNQLLWDTVDEYLISREYDEFIDILRYFLETTPMTPGAVHVICRGELVFACDESLSALDLSKMEAIARETEDLHPQDVLMSALITRSPERLVIHTDNKDMAFVRTLTRVFDQRVEFCRCAPVCELFVAAIDAYSSGLYTTI